MADHELVRFPPVLQLAALGLLALYVLLSVLARLTPHLDWLWDDPDEAQGAVHVIEYTVVPALVLFTAAVAVYLNWRPGAPLAGGWTLRQLLVGPLTALAGGVLIVAVNVRRSRGREQGWGAFAAMLLGIGLLAFGVFAVGRVVR